MKNKILFIKYIMMAFALSAIIYQLSATGQARAEGTSLSVSPTLIKVSLEENDSAQAFLTLVNKGSRSLTLNPELRLFRPSADGEIEYLPLNENQSEIFDKVKFFDAETETSQITLGPQQTKRIRLVISTTDEENSRDYYFSVIFVSIPQPNVSATTHNTYTTIQAGIATNVLLSLNPTESVSGEIDEFSVPFFLQEGPAYFSVKIKNTGPHVINPTGTINIKNMFGQTIGKVDVPAANILSNGERYLTNRSQEADPVVIWDEKFLIGLYQADITVKLSDDGPSLHKSTSFLALPIKSISVAIISISIFSLIYRRVKKRMN